MKRWEIGSDFDWSGERLANAPLSYLWPEKFQLFSTATASLLAFGALLKERHDSPLRIHIPSFYCMSLVDKLRSVFEVSWYRDLPDQDSPDFDTLHPLPDDLVIAVNLFGIRQQQFWEEWKSKHQDVILIEDHTHDPFSSWARNSTADYAFSSLHKTLPIPDGGVFWSPKNYCLPKPLGGESPGASTRLTGMTLKRLYLEGYPIDKDSYLKLCADGQNELDDEHNSEVSSFTHNILKFLDVKSFRQKRQENIKQFIHLSSEISNPYWTPLFLQWEKDAVPLNSIIVSQNESIRDALRQHLIRYNIFPAIHWKQPFQGISLGDPEAIALSQKILTIPTDQRYESGDIIRIIGILGSFTPGI